MMGTVQVGYLGDILFAQRATTDWDLFLAAGALFGVIGLGIWAIVKVKRWREADSADHAPPPDLQLEHYQKMVAEGLLDPAELARIQDQIEKRCVPPSAGPPTTDAPPQT
jgi:hypothetical protein